LPFTSKSQPWNTQREVAVLPAAVGEVGLPVRAVPVEQPELLLRVAKQNEVFSKHMDRQHRPGQPVELIDQRNRLP
jgi:hypothetical protein